MQPFPLNRVFTLLESGLVVLVTTHDGQRANVMTISWSMVLDFEGRFAIATGEWNHSFTALCQRRECVIAIPTVDLLDTLVGIGTCCGVDTDKFARFDLTALPGSIVGAPLIGQCLANIECQVVDILGQHDIVVLQAVAAHLDEDRQERRLLHAVGDGTFIVDGQRLDRRAMMASKLPPGI